MNVVILVHEFFPDYYAGTSRVALNLAKQLKRMGHKIIVIAYDPSVKVKSDYNEGTNLFWKRYIFEGVETISFKYKKEDRNLNFDIFNSDFDFSSILKVLNKALNNRIDILHVVHPMRIGSMIKVLKKKFNPSIVLTLTDLWLLCPRICFFNSYYTICEGPSIKRCANCGYKKADIERRFLEAKSLINLTDYVIFPSNLIKTIFEIYFTEIKNYKVIPHGIDYKDIKYYQSLTSKEALNFGYVGPVARHKGVHILIKAFRKLKVNNIKLKIYGECLDEQYWSAIKKIVKQDYRIEYYGKYDYKEISNIYKSIDVTVVPSICYESYGLSLIEALANKTPVVASNVIGSALEYIKDGVNGFVFHIGDVNNLYNILKRLSEQPMVIKKLKENITYPPRIEEEAFKYELLYKRAKS